LKYVDACSPPRTLSNFSRRISKQQPLYRLFLLDPNDVKVESNFDLDEVNSVEYELLLDD